jgi:dGTPase
MMDVQTQIKFFDRVAKELSETKVLHAAASFSKNTKGRKFPEEEDDLRTVWERDRDRIVHSVAFRRLMYKTQVFVNWEGDHYRTRLSHSLEVTQVARSVGSALFLNEPLCEVLALAHDLGHPPFGHRGEKMLNEIMQDSGGFRHNNQVGRVLDLLERRSPNYPGLNLTFEVRESLLKHEPNAEWPMEFRPRPKQPCLEAQVVDMADSTAYHAHDLEDGLHSDHFSEEEINDTVLWRGAREGVELRHPGFLKNTKDASLRIKRIANEVIKICINDLIHQSAQNIAKANPKSVADVRGMNKQLIQHSAPIAKEVAELRRFLQERFYQHPHLVALSRHSDQVLLLLFRALRKRPEEMPPWYKRWIDEVGLDRAVCDYIGGMTDRFAEEEYTRLTGRKAADR